MTLVVEQPDLAVVHNAVAEACRVTGERVRLTTVGKLAPRQAGPFADAPCVVTAATRRVEIVLHDPADVGLLTPALRHLDELEWRPIVLINVGAIGGAHPELRGTPCLLQPWWQEGDGVVFGSFETP